MNYWKILFTLSVILLFIVACDHNYKDDKKMPDGLRKVMLGENNLNFKYWLGSSDNSNDEKSYQLYIADDSLKHLNLLPKGLYDIRFSYSTDDIQTITFYTDTIFNTKDVKLLSDNILGVQVHYKSDEYLKTEVFDYQNNAIRKIASLTSFVDYFSFNDTYDCSKIFNTDYTTVLIIFNENIKQKKGKANFKKNLVVYKNVQNRIEKN
ncbi:hypothetical protein [Kordia antarctica]|nr:hypothetical protein [Kordia antarctica]